MSNYFQAADDAMLGAVSFGPPRSEGLLRAQEQSSRTITQADPRAQAAYDLMSRSPVERARIRERAAKAEAERRKAEQAAALARQAAVVLQQAAARRAAEQAAAERAAAAQRAATQVAVARAAAGAAQTFAERRNLELARLAVKATEARVAARQAEERRAAARAAQQAIKAEAQRATAKRAAEKRAQAQRKAEKRAARKMAEAQRKAASRGVVVVAPPPARGAVVVAPPPSITVKPSGVVVTPRGTVVATPPPAAPFANIANLAKSAINAGANTRKSDAMIAAVRAQIARNQMHHDVRDIVARLRASGVQRGSHRPLAGHFRDMAARESGDRQVYFAALSAYLGM